MDNATIEAADHAARHWRFAGTWRPGDDQQREAFCRMLLDTFNPYRPAVIEWPVLDAETRQRVISLPIWDIAVQTEGRARRRILSYAATVRDPLLRQALEHMGFEEGRHKEVLSHLVAAYGIQLEPEPEYLEPRNPEWGFLVTGYSECIDSFFAFGLFALAKRSGFFPPELVETFEPVIQEEGRHILFFINWVDWHRRTMPLWRRPVVPAEDARGVGLPGLGAHRACPQRERRAEAGRELHGKRSEFRGRRHRYRRLDGSVPGGGRPPARRLRPTLEAPAHGAPVGAACAQVHADPQNLPRDAGEVGAKRRVRVPRVPPN